MKSRSVIIGTEARDLFKNLRNRYSRDKKRIRVQKVSGKGSQEVKEAEQQSSELFKYLRWLDPYIQPRKSKSNIYLSSGSQDHSNDDSEGLDDVDSETHLRCTTLSSEISSLDFETSGTASSTQRKEYDNMKSETTGQPKYRKRKSNVDKTVDKAELELIQSLSTRLTSKSEERKEKDEDDLFCELLATQLRQLNPRDKSQIKMQINNTVYNQLMKPPMSTSLYHEQAANSFSAEIGGHLTPLQPAKQFHDTTTKGHKQFHVPSAEEIKARAQFPPGYYFSWLNRLAPGHLFKFWLRRHWFHVFVCLLVRDKNNRLRGKFSSHLTLSAITISTKKKRMMLTSVTVIGY